MSMFKNLFTKKEKDCCKLTIEEVKKETEKEEKNAKKNDCCK